MRKNSATPEIHPALSHRCPFCHADPGQACRTERGRGRETEHLHSRRIRIVHPLPRAADSDSSTDQALCCECGQLRTVSSKYYFGHRDENRSWGGFDHPQGWRVTGTLKCTQCGQRTRHALIRALDSRFDDYDETLQRYALGGEYPTEYAPDLERLRADYQKQFPRNPKLHHRFWVKDADELRAAGETHMPALCGDIGEIPREWNSRPGSDTDDQLPPDEPDWLTEFEDPETGMWWVDMTCVNCLRVANTRRLARRRTYLEQILAWLATHPEDIDDQYVDELVDYWNRVRKADE